MNDEQMDEYMRIIGASEGAGICGISKYKSAFQTYRKIVHGELIVPDDDQADHILRGIYFEKPTVMWYGKKFGLKVVYPEGHYLHPELPYIGALPDALALGSDGKPDHGIEVKSPGPFAEGWGDGPSDVPTDADIQCRIGMACTGLSSWRVLAVMGGRLRVFRIDRDLTIEAEIVRRLDEFWVYHVLPKKEPPLSHAEGDKSWVAERYPRALTKARLPADGLTSGQKAVIDLLRMAKKERDTWQETYDTAATQLKAIIGELAGIDLGNGERIDWFDYVERPKIDHEAVAHYVAGLAQMALTGGAKGNEIAEKLARGELKLADVEKQFIKPASAPKRPFVPRFR